MYIVYILKSVITHHFYVGQTDDLDKRILRHNSGKVKWTSRYVPWKIVFKQNFDTREEALVREKYFKSHAGRNWLKKNVGQ